MGAYIAAIVAVEVGDNEARLVGIAETFDGVDGDIKGSHGDRTLKMERMVLTWTATVESRLEILEEGCCVFVREEKQANMSRGEPRGARRKVMVTTSGSSSRSSTGNLASENFNQKPVSGPGALREFMSCHTRHTRYKGSLYLGPSSRK